MYFCIMPFSDYSSAAEVELRIVASKWRQIQPMMVIALFSPWPDPAVISREMTASALCSKISFILFVRFQPFGFDDFSDETVIEIVNLCIINDAFQYC